MWCSGTLEQARVVLVGRTPKPRRGPNKWAAEHTPIDMDRVRYGRLRTEIKRGVEYSVQTSTGANAEDDKTWVCPHCNLQITKGIAHTVAWDSVRGVETRRHFHNACWKAFQGPLL